MGKVLWLVDPEFRHETVNSYRPDNRPNWIDKVDTLLYHWTATPHTGRPEHQGSDIARQIRWLKCKGGSSTHFDILRDGTVLQGCPLDSRAWHAGSSNCPVQGEVLDRFNSRSIGIDLDSVGNLYPHNGGFIDYYGKVALRDGEKPSMYKGPSPCLVGGMYYEPYTAKAVEALLLLVLRLVEVFPQLRGAKRIDRNASYGASGSSLSGSVGEEGQNRKADVRLVQGWLGTDVDGFVGPKTIGAIRDAQSAWMSRPDGRVDPGGRTERELKPATPGGGLKRHWLIGHLDVDRYKNGKLLGPKSDPGTHFPWRLVEAVVAGELDASQITNNINWASEPGVYVEENCG